MSSKIAELKISSRMGVETGVSDLFTAIASLNPKMGQTKNAQIKIAINEACINAIEHGNKGDESRSIFCEVFESDDCYEISISDEGDSLFLPEPGKIPTRKEMEEKIQNSGRRSKKNRGMGTYLIHYFSDEVRYEKNASKGTKIILKFNLG